MARNKKEITMNVKELRQAISDLPEDMEVMFRRIAPFCGNVESAGSAKVSTYGFFGESIPCVIIEPITD